MAEPISVQQLKDASLDANSLGEAVNGDENVVVTTRLGETYPSIKSVIENAKSKLGFITSEADRAEAASDSAFVDAERAEAVLSALAGGDLGIYSSEVLGIEGTVDGDMFWVFPNNDNDLENMVLYQNSSSTAVELYDNFNLNAFMVKEGANWEAGE